MKVTTIVKRLIIFFFITLFQSLTLYAQRGGRPDEDYPTGGGGLTVILIIIGIVYLIIQSRYENKNRRSTYRKHNLGTDNTVEFGRYAVHDTKTIEWPVAMIKSRELRIFSKTEPEKNGTISDYISIPIDRITQISIGDRKFPLKKAEDFRGAILIEDQELNLTELVFRNDTESQNRIYSERMKKLKALVQKEKEKPAPNIGN